MSIAVNVAQLAVIENKLINEFNRQIYACSGTHLCVEIRQFIIKPTLVNADKLARHSVGRNQCQNARHNFTDDYVAWKINRLVGKDSRMSHSHYMRAKTMKYLNAS